ncbi:c-type cytochrome [Pirellulales bacterium]|nr:c-type cytochrome [Pirellulales bacterium]
MKYRPSTPILPPIPVRGIWAIGSICLVNAAAVVLHGQGYSPEVAVSKMTVADGLTIQLFASEPNVRQPNFVKMDNRGRLWTIQYLQYPLPAGLKRVQMDQYWRTVYDRVPEPPPHGPRGADVITICEDTDGDGVADRFKNFVEGLNLTSGLAFGHGGVFVLQAPYLLFYPDRNRDDVPDGDPEVLLKGFGMEDAQSLANHLTWGPDGWLYGVNGSTTTCNIRGIEFQQGCWRYHPLRDQFELFCEGGGNIYGLTFDSDGNLFYTTNGGPFVHAVQGGYFYKWFGKHGPLHNPYAYGYFNHVQRDQDPGVPTGGTIYYGDSFPPEYRGKFFVNSFLGHHGSWWSVTPHGTTVKATYGGELFNSNDTWFGPTDLCLGADGSIYVCDFHEQRQHHPDPDSQWDRSNGRIYRIEAEGTQPVVGLDLHRLSSKQLVGRLTDENRWYADRARMILADRRDETLNAMFEQMALDQGDPQRALEGLWGLHLNSALTDDLARDLMDHPYEYVRSWVARLLGDKKDVSAQLQRRLVELAEDDPSVVVRCQLAATAKRLPGEDGLPIVYALLGRDLDADDERISLLLWWAIEANAMTHTDSLLDYFAKHNVWDNESNHLPLRNLLRRWSADGSAAGYDAASTLLSATPENRLDEMVSLLGQGLSERGSGSESLTAKLSPFIYAYWNDNRDDAARLELALLAEVDGAYDHLLGRMSRTDIDESTCTQILELLARFGESDCTQYVLPLVGGDQPDGIQAAAIRVLNRVAPQQLAKRLLDHYSSMSSDLRSSARAALFRRSESAAVFLKLVEEKRIDPGEVPIDELRPLALHKSAQIDALVRKHWGSIGRATPGEKLANVNQFTNDLRLGSGDPMRGKVLFNEHCGKCHKLFGEGNTIGPDLTNAARTDVHSMLMAIVDPNAVIRAQYLTFAIQTIDGRTFTGLMAQQDAASVTLLDAENKRTRILREEIERIKESTVSLMPEKILDPLTAQQRRDLFRYLGSSVN